MNTKQIRKILLVILLSSVSLQSVVAASASDDVGSRASGPSLRGIIAAGLTAMAGVGAAPLRGADCTSMHCSEGDPAYGCVAYRCTDLTHRKACEIATDPTSSWNSMVVALLGVWDKPPVVANHVGSGNIPGLAGYLAGAVNDTRTTTHVFALDAVSKLPGLQYPEAAELAVQALTKECRTRTRVSADQIDLIIELLQK